MKTLAATAFVGLVVACPPPAQAGAVDVKISIDKNCTVPRIGKTHVKRSNDDFLVWKFSSKCRRSQDVLICAKDAVGSTNAKPWLDCTGISSSVSTINATIPPRSAAEIRCTIDWRVMGDPPIAKKYDVCVVNADTGSALACPPSGEPCKQFRSELALEVEP